MKTYLFGAHPQSGIHSRRRIPLSELLTAMMERGWFSVPLRTVMVRSWARSTAFRTSSIGRRSPSAVAWGWIWTISPGIGNVWGVPEVMDT
jgi:hypothetical protein